MIFITAPDNSPVLKILVLPKYHAEGSSSRYRYYNYFSYFKQQHHSIVCKPLLYDGYVRDLYQGKKKGKRIWMTFAGMVKRSFWLLANKKKFDIIIIEKELFTFVPFWVEQWLLKGTKFVLDYDDNISARYQSGIARLFLSKKILQLGKLANGITVGNHWYVHFYNGLDKSRIHYLPTVIDRDLYEAAPGPVEPVTPLVIVWIGSPSTAKYLQQIDDVMVQLQASHACILKVIGAKPILRCQSEYVEWTEATEIAELKKADIGIMPLQNNAWENGKCGLKLIQYMGCGLPVVASDSVSAREIIDEETGCIAGNKEDWIGMLTTLLQSATLRQSMGEKAKAKIYTKYTYQAWAPLFLGWLSEIKNGKI